MTARHRRRGRALRLHLFKRKGTGQKLGPFSLERFASRQHPLVSDDSRLFHADRFVYVAVIGNRDVKLIEDKTVIKTVPQALTLDSCVFAYLVRIVIIILDRKQPFVEKGFRIVFVSNFPSRFIQSAIFVFSQAVIFKSWVKETAAGGESRMKTGAEILFIDLDVLRILVASREQEDCQNGKNSEYAVVFHTRNTAAKARPWRQ